MIDYLRIDLTHFGRKRLEDCGCEFLKPGLISEKTGEFIPDKNYRSEYMAQHKNLIIEIFKSGKIILSGSLHVFWNDGIHNYNDFNYTALQEVIEGLQHKFGIDLLQSPIRHIEFAKNLYDLPFAASQIVQNLMIHSGRGIKPKPFKYILHNTPSEYKCLLRDWYIIKIYDKGLHKNRAEEVFRLECKTTKMHRLNEMGITTLGDLTRSATMDKLIGMLQFLWSGVLISDWTIKEENLTQYQIIKLKDWRNPGYWIKLHEVCKKKNRNKFNDQKREYLLLVQEHSENVHKIINDSLSGEKCKNTRISLNAKCGQQMQEHTLVMDDLAPPSIRQCRITKIDISNQKEGSQYLRESTLAKIYFEAPDLYQSLKSEFGPRKKQIITLKAEFEVIAKNIRNRDSNPRKRERDTFKKYNNSLFPFVPRIPLYAMR